MTNTFPRIPDRALDALEIQTFKDLQVIKTSFDSVRGTFITTGAPYEAPLLRRAS